MKHANDDSPPVILLEEFPDAARPMVIFQEAEKRGFKFFTSFSGEKTLPKGLPLIGAFVRQGSPLIKECQEKELPCIQMGISPSRAYDTSPSLSMDHAQCGRVGAEYFIHHHFVTLAYVGNEAWKDSDQIYRSFQATCSEVEIDTHFFRLDDPGKSHEQHFSDEPNALKAWAKELPKPIGILAYNDRVACRLISFCSHLGLRVPQDISILGIGNSFFHCETAPVKISSINLPWAKMWRNAFTILDTLLRGDDKKLSPQLITPGNVTERESTDVLPVDDYLVSKAINFIWNHYQEDVSIVDFVVSENVSRSTVQRRFQKCLGRGFNEELGRKRLDVAQKLLANTALTINEVSSKVGFNSRYYFHRSFKKSFDITPHEYRSVYQC
jgi:LacI family transcriptional regulator